MNTVVVWVMLASLSTTSQNRTAWIVDNIATEAECRVVLRSLQSLWSSDGQTTSVRGTCVKYTKVVPATR